LNLNFFIKKRLNRLFQYFKNSDPKEGLDVIASIGHRGYVGGLWEEIGSLQMNFLLKEGLERSNCLLDIGCGSLRGGVHFINYLDEGNYIGIDKNSKLISEGIKHELNEKLINSKKPILINTENFNFKLIKKTPDISLAQSLFTHLNIEDIRFCLKNLRELVPNKHRFYATFLEGSTILNRKNSNSFSVFFYSFSSIRDLALELGWEAYYIGDWEHPRNQKMIKFISI